MLNNAKPSLTNLPLLLLLLVGAQGGRRRGRGVFLPQKLSLKNRRSNSIDGLNSLRTVSLYQSTRSGHSIVKLLNQKGEFFLPNLFGHGLTNAVKRRLEKTTCTAMHCDEELEIHSN